MYTSRGHLLNARVILSRESSFNGVHYGMHFDQSITAWLPPFILMNEVEEQKVCQRVFTKLSL